MQFVWTFIESIFPLYDTHKRVAFCWRMRYWISIIIFILPPITLNGPVDWWLSFFTFTDSFVNSQEWTLSRAVPDLRLGIVGSLASGKSALVHRYLTGSYMQEESPEGGRFKKEISVDGQSYLLLIRDEGGSPELQVHTNSPRYITMGNRSVKGDGPEKKKEKIPSRSKWNFSCVEILYY